MRPAAGEDGNQGLDQGALLDGQVAGVSLGSPTQFYGPAPLSGQTLSRCHMRDKWVRPAV